MHVFKFHNIGKMNAEIERLALELGTPATKRFWHCKAGHVEIARLEGLLAAKHPAPIAHPPLARIQNLLADPAFSYRTPPTIPAPATPARTTNARLPTGFVWDIGEANEKIEELNARIERREPNFSGKFGIWNIKDANTEIDRLEKVLAEISHRTTSPTTVPAPATPSKVLFGRARFLAALAAGAEERAKAEAVLREQIEKIHNPTT